MRSRRQIYRGISKRAPEALERSEGLDVEFKEFIASLDSDDLVAFKKDQRRIPTLMRLIKQNWFLIALVGICVVTLIDVTGTIAGM